MSEKKCPSCNAEVVAQSKFCPECGTAMSQQKKQKAQPTKNTSSRDTMIIVAVLALATTSYFMFNKPEPPPAPPQQQQVQDDSHQNVDGMTSALSDMPTDYNSLVQLGNQKMDEGNFPMAAECYKRALIIKGDSPNVRTDYGACLHGMGLPQRAVEEFMTVTRQYPKHTIANFNLGIVYYSVNQLDSAKTYFDRFLTFETEGKTADAARNYLTEINKK